MRLRMVLPALLLLPCGCTTVQLERSTARQAATWTDLQYKQVLDNVALACASPGALPHFAVAGSGVTQVTDSATAADVFAPFYFPGNSNAAPGAGAGRQVSAQWDLAPVTDPDKLEGIRCAFRLATGCPPEDAAHCTEVLRNLLGREPDPAHYPQGWFCVGTRHQVPRAACYVGRYRDTYAWVLPEGVEGLTRTTLSVLDVATTESLPHTRKVESWYAGEPGEQKPLLTRVERTEREAGDKDGLTPRRGRVDFFRSRGLNFVP
jgi:hypothetical protein